MNLYFIPVDIRHWNMFEVVRTPGHIESFIATKAMTSGDLVVLHVGQQDKTVKSGIYAYGTVISEPYIKNDAPGERCNNRLTVDVRIDAISFTKPYISHDACQKYIKQFRTAHRIDSAWHDEIMSLCK